jgi:hypothetical protein
VKVVDSSSVHGKCFEKLQHIAETGSDKITSVGWIGTYEQTEGSRFQLLALKITLSHGKLIKIGEE